MRIILPTHRTFRWTVTLSLLAVGACTSGEGRIASFGAAYSEAELRECMEGPGAEFAGLMRGPDAPNRYCACTLEKIAENYPRADRARLSVDSVIANRGILGLADSDYTEWVTFNLRVRTACTASILGEESVS
jgi:hypothetical protein